MTLLLFHILIISRKPRIIIINICGKRAPIMRKGIAVHSFFTDAEAVANADIQSIRKCFEVKGHRCAQGHCIRKLLRIIYHLLTTGQQFNPKLLV